MKKKSGKSSAKTKKPAKKKRSPRSKKPIDLVEVRKDIANLVGSEAAELTQAVLEEGRKGQLAPVKYLFEMVGLYPSSEANEAKPEEASLAKTLLHRLGLPDIPVKRGDDDPPMTTNLVSAKRSEEDPEEKILGTAGLLQQRLNEQTSGEGADEDDDVAVLAGSIP